MSNYFNGRNTIGFTCDSCGRETQGCSIVNGMKFCAKCYQETFGNNDKDKQILDLKLQIHELQEQLNNLKSKFEIGQKIYYLPTDVYYKDSIIRNCVRTAKITGIQICIRANNDIGVRYTLDDYDTLQEDKLFATREEAEKKLKELKENNNGNND